jgi:hypothetical protein
MTSLLDPALRSVSRDALQAFLDQRLREDINLEYKQVWNQKALESVAAMANTYGGLILVGVPRDARDAELPAAEASGVDPAAREAIVNQCYMKLQPSFAPEVLVVPLDDSELAVLILRIYPERVGRPVVLEGKIWVRLETRNAAATRDQIRALFETGRPNAFVPGTSELGDISPRRSGGYLPLDDFGIPALVMRTAIAAEIPPSRVAFGLIDTPAREALATALSDSPLSQTLAAQTETWRRSFDASGWREGGEKALNLSWVATLRWLAHVDDLELPLRGQCVLALPAGRNVAPRLSLYLDVAFQPVELTERIQQIKPSRPEVRLDLEQLYLLLRAELDTALDVVPGAVFERVLAVPMWEMLGPVCFLDAGPWEPVQGERRWLLGDFLHVSQFRRDAAPEWPASAMLPTPPGADLTTAEARDQLVQEGLTRLLLDGGCRKFEPLLSAIRGR